MKLFQKKEAPRTVRKYKPQIRITFKGSKFAFNQTAVEKLKISAGDSVSFGIEHERLYVMKGGEEETSFVLRNSNGTGLVFGSQELVKDILTACKWAKNGKVSMRLELGESKITGETTAYRLINQ